MITTPWNAILTAVFVITGLVCLSALVRPSRMRRARAEQLTDEDVIDIGHCGMSASMILMTWFSQFDAVIWAQAVLFTIISLALVLGLRGAPDAAHRVDIGVHIILHSAMVWMLAAMPLLMTGADMSGGAGGDHHGGGAMGAPSVTPVWADGVNTLFIAMCAAGTFWWLLRLATAHVHRLHTLCHVLMAAGMGTMLWVMNR